MLRAYSCLFHEALGQVLDQLNEEKTRQQDEMLKLHIDLRTQQAPATFQAAEAPLALGERLTVTLKRQLDTCLLDLEVDMNRQMYSKHF